jgi:hypothetical protein
MFSRTICIYYGKTATIGPKTPTEGARHSTIARSIILQAVLLDATEIRIPALSVPMSLAWMYESLSVK